jgi:hypothetical protein
MHHSNYDDGMLRSIYDRSMACPITAEEIYSSE